MRFFKHRGTENSRGERLREIKKIIPLAKGKRLFSS